MKRKTYVKRRRRSTARNKKVSTVRKRVRSLVFAVLTIFIASAVLFGFLGYKFVNAPFSKASQVDYQDTEKVWNTDITNLVFVRVSSLENNDSDVSALSLISFDNLNNRYYIYNFPLEVEFEYPGEYGTGTLKDIYKIGNEDNSKGVDLILATIQRNLAISADGYVIMDNEGITEVTNHTGGINFEDLSSVLRIKNTLNIPQMITAFREEAVTNLKLADIYSILRFIKSTSETSSEINDLNIFYLLDDTNWDQLWTSNLGLSDVKKESVKVLIVNGSKEPKIPGLASWGSRITKNIGASVLGSENAFAEYEESVIIAEDANLHTVKLLQRTLGIEKVLNPNELDKTMEYNPKIQRAQVTLVLTNF